MAVKFDVVNRSRETRSPPYVVCGSAVSGNEIYRDRTARRRGIGWPSTPRPVAKYAGGIGRTRSGRVAGVELHILLKAARVMDAW